MVITTKVGDKGKTMILFGHSISKSDPLLDVCGSVDELNASLGVARAHVVAPGLKQDILDMQHKLFILGAEVATKQEDYAKLKQIINKDQLADIESEIEQLERYNSLDNWFIPGESPSSAFLEQARTIARRLERKLWKFNYHNETALIFVNRLSDYLWLLAQKEEYYLKGIQPESSKESNASEQQKTIV